MARKTNSATATATETKAAPAPAPAAPAAPQAPRYTYAPFRAAQGQPGKPDYVPARGWPAKAAAGNSIRAYCAQVAQALSKAHPKGFTALQFAAALAANAKGSTYKQPSTGWGSEAQPNSTAKQHANWFCGEAQQWLVPVAEEAK